MIFDVAKHNSLFWDSDGVARGPIHCYDDTQPTAMRISMSLMGYMSIRGIDRRNVSALQVHFSDTRCRFHVSDTPGGAALFKVGFLRFAIDHVNTSAEEKL